MKVVKTPRVRGWRWGEEPDGIDPQSQMGFKGGGEGILMASVCGQLMPDQKAETSLQPTGKKGGEGYEKF